MGDSTGVQRRYREFAETECRGYSDLYYRLALSVSVDDAVATFLANMDESQPNLFLASIQLLTGPTAMPATGSELRAFVERRGDEVRAVMRARRTQTNEVGRCAVLLPALPPGPLALVEVGGSAAIFLDDVTVSRKHAEFRRTPEDTFLVRDVGSLNGTYVNRERIEEAALNNGDEVQVGKFRLAFYASRADDDG